MACDMGRATTTVQGTELPQRGRFDPPSGRSWEAGGYRSCPSAGIGVWASGGHCDPSWAFVCVTGTSHLTVLASVPAPLQGGSTAPVGPSPLPEAAAKARLGKRCENMLLPGIKKTLGKDLGVQGNTAAVPGTSALSLGLRDRKYLRAPEPGARSLAGSASPRGI